jgi:hypothetical protein
VTNKPSSLFPSQNAGRKKKGKREKFERKKIILGAYMFF